MYCVRNVTKDLYWVGANDHRLALFENCFPIPRGVSYNAYCLLDEKTALFDTVDWSACRQLLENLEHVLAGRPLDYLVVNHLEPDHAACIEEVLLRYPGVTVISNEKAFLLMRQFGFRVDDHPCIQVKEGDYVSVGQPLATIAQSNRLMLRADVSERYYSSLPMVQSAHFKTPYDEQVYRLADLRGRLLSYGRASGGDSFFVPVTFEFDNKGAILPGSFVEVYLLTKPLEQVISVPVESLIEEQGLYSVYVRLDADCYRKQPVTLGANNGVEVQILSGLHGGEAVVTKGAHQVKLASASNAIPAHSHHH